MLLSVSRSKRALDVPVNLLFVRDESMKTNKNHTFRLVMLRESFSLLDSVSSFRWPWDCEIREIQYVKCL